MLHSFARKARLAACLTALAASTAKAASPATQPPASLDDEAVRQFALCLEPDPSRLADAVKLPALPPGLGRTENIAIVRIPTRDGALYSYRDNGGNEIICGIAVYGVDAGRIERRLRAMIDGSRRFTPASPGLDELAGSGAPRGAYWGDVRTPGMGGVHLLRRAPSPRAPALEADMHQTLVR
jgi:hypothetical protein